MNFSPSTVSILKSVQISYMHTIEQNVRWLGNSLNNFIDNFYNCKVVAINYCITDQINLSKSGWRIGPNLQEIVGSMQIVHLNQITPNKLEKSNQCLFDFGSAVQMVGH